MPWWGDLLVAVTLVVAALGCVIPVLPGGFLALAAIALWAVVEQSLTGWIVLVLAALLILAGQVVKYVWPGRRLARSGVLARSILAGGLLGIVGFFVVPVVGLPLGFVLGIFLAELARTDGASAAWASTVEALKATGLSVLVELASVLLAGAVWATAVVAVV